MTLAGVAEKVGPISEKVYDQASKVYDEAVTRVYPHAVAAGQAVREGARHAYRTALDHPRVSIGGIVLAAALVGGLLWYMFGDAKQPVQRRRKGHRVRAGAERRKRHRGAARAAA